jgi:hypothetical protein
MNTRRWLLHFTWGVDLSTSSSRKTSWRVPNIFTPQNPCLYIRPSGKGAWTSCGSSKVEDTLEHGRTGVGLIPAGELYCP